MVCRVRLGKQREVKAAEDGKAAGSSRAAVGWQMLFGPAPAFAFYHQTTESFILRERVVCGPMQRLPTYVLSGWGKALTGEGIRHVFSLGGPPFLLCSCSCEVCPSSSPRLTVCRGHQGSVVCACSHFCPREGTGAPCCSSLQVCPSRMSVGSAGRVTEIRCSCTASGE